MTKEYIIAVIGGLSTVIAAVASSSVKTIIENKSYSNSGKQRSLTGDWRGTTIQDDGKIITLVCSIKSKSRTLTGAANVLYSQSSLPIKFKGVYLDEDHVQLNYITSNNQVKNFGVQILKINANCTKLTGLTVGFGNETEQVICGKTELQKVG